MPPSPSRRVATLVDGYNLYHSIDDLGRHNLKWLNLKALSEFLIKQDTNSVLTKVMYFSAYATWKKEQYARHREYVKALKTEGVKIILGNFKKKNKNCKNCGATWVGHEEKETDVNISINLVGMALQNQCDKIMLITGDTDIAPACRMAKQIAPNLHITVVLPPRRQAVGSLLNCADSKMSLSVDILQRCQFPPEVRASDGTLVCSIPDKYK